jgi:hypothetical protein
MALDRRRDRASASADVAAGGELCWGDVRPLVVVSAAVGLDRYWFELSLE